MIKGHSNSSKSFGQSKGPSHRLLAGMHFTCPLLKSQLNWFEGQILLSICGTYVVNLIPSMVVRLAKSLPARCHEKVNSITSIPTVFSLFLLSVFVYLFLIMYYMILVMWIQQFSRYKDAIWLSYFSEFLLARQWWGGWCSKRSWLHSALLPVLIVSIWHGSRMAFGKREWWQPPQSQIQFLQGESEETCKDRAMT